MIRYSSAILSILPLIVAVACQSSPTPPPTDTKQRAIAAGGTAAPSSSDRDRVATADQTPTLPQANPQVLEQLKKHEPEFKEHYDRHYADSGYGYNQYRPAYQYGYELAMDARYRSMQWSTLELQARRGWDEATLGLWDRYKDAVRFGWERGVIAQRG
ncbi:MAG TPA: hypothetical protein VHF07_00760 [Nitrospiraceae bacterium]|nr:hypothetical protein [Nitrospiraceae bacterium]